MSHHHDHHDHHHLEINEKNKNILKISFLLTILFATFEIIAGVFSHSISLLSEGIHMFSDGLSLGLGFLAAYLALKPVSLIFSFGFKRFETIAAFINGLALIIIPAIMIIEAVERIINGSNPDPGSMLLVASIGLAINLFVATLLFFKGNQDNLNVKAAFLHVLADLFSSISVIVGSIVIFVWDFKLIDPIISIVVSIIIISGGLKITKQSFLILMDKTPEDFPIHVLLDKLSHTKGVLKVLDIHAWNLSNEETYAIISLEIKEDFEEKEVRSLIEEELEGKHVHWFLETKMQHLNIVR